jgi:U3 small nucleolar RNA-associated protein 25
MPGVDLEEDNNTTTRLLTLLNVSALKSSKRKRTESIEPTPRVKLNKRRSVQFDTTDSTSSASKEDEGKSETPSNDATEIEDAAAVAEDIEDDQGTCGSVYRKLSALANGFSERKTRPI